MTSSVVIIRLDRAVHVARVADLNGVMLFITEDGEVVRVRGWQGMNGVHTAQNVERQVGVDESSGRITLLARLP